MLLAENTCGDTLDDEAIFDTIQMENVHELGCPHAVLELMPAMSKEVPELPATLRLLKSPAPNLKASRHADFIFQAVLPKAPRIGPTVAPFDSIPPLMVPEAAFGYSAIDLGNTSTEDSLVR